jgi:hypothetical protein
MKQKLQTSLIFKGSTYEGEDCIIVAGDDGFSQAIGTMVERELRDFAERKNVKITITIKAESAE